MRTPSLLLLSSVLAVLATAADAAAAAPERLARVRRANDDVWAGNSLAAASTNSVWAQNATTSSSISSIPTSAAPVATASRPAATATASGAANGQRVAQAAAADADADANRSGSSSSSSSVATRRTTTTATATATATCTSVPEARCSRIASSISSALHSKHITGTRSASLLTKSFSAIVSNRKYCDCTLDAVSTPTTTRRSSSTSSAPTTTSKASSTSSTTSSTGSDTNTSSTTSSTTTSSPSSQPTTRECYDREKISSTGRACQCSKPHHVVSGSNPITGLPNGEKFCYYAFPGQDPSDPSDGGEVNCNDGQVINGCVCNAPHVEKDNSVLDTGIGSGLLGKTCYWPENHDSNGGSSSDIGSSSTTSSTSSTTTTSGGGSTPTITPKPLPDNECADGATITAFCVCTPPQHTARPAGGLLGGEICDYGLDPTSPPASPAPTTPTTSGGPTPTGPTNTPPTNTPTPPPGTCGNGESVALLGGCTCEPPAQVVGLPGLGGTCVYPTATPNPPINTPTGNSTQSGGSSTDQPTGTPSPTDSNSGGSTVTPTNTNTNTNTGINSASNSNSGSGSDAATSTFTPVSNVETGTAALPTIFSASSATSTSDDNPYAFVTQSGAVAAPSASPQPSDAPEQQLPGTYEPLEGVPNQPVNTTSVSILFRDGPFAWKNVGNNNNNTALLLYAAMPDIIAVTLNTTRGKIINKQLLAYQLPGDRDSTFQKARAIWQGFVPTESFATLQNEVRNGTSELYTTQKSSTNTWVASNIEHDFDISYNAGTPKTAQNNVIDSTNNHDLVVRNALIGVFVGLFGLLLIILLLVLLRNRKRKQAASSVASRRRPESIRSTRSALRETWEPTNDERRRVMTGDLAETWSHAGGRVDREGSISPAHGSDPFADSPDAAAHGTSFGGAAAAAGAAGAAGAVAAHRAAAPSVADTGASAAIGRRSSRTSHQSERTENTQHSGTSLTPSQRIRLEYEQGRAITTENDEAVNAPRRQSGQPEMTQRSNAFF